VRRWWLVGGGAVVVVVVAVVAILLVTSGDATPPDVARVQDRMAAADPSGVRTGYTCIRLYDVEDGYQCWSGNGRCNGQDIYDVTHRTQPAAFTYAKSGRVTIGKDC
jgi:hypothetical protein